MKTDTLQLRCQLSDNELIDYGKRAADYSHELAELEEALKDEKARLAARIKHVEAEGGKLQSAIRAGYEYRGVECTISMDDPVKGKKTIIRTDTGEVVATESMDEEDRQMTIEEVGAVQ